MAVIILRKNLVLMDEDDMIEELRAKGLWLI